MMKILTIFLIILFPVILPVSANDLNLGDIANFATSNVEPIVRFITALSYAIGVGFALIALLKLKQHRDNPQSVQLSQPIFMIFVAVALIWLPQVFGTVAQTLFNSTEGTAGVNGNANPWSKR